MVLDIVGTGGDPYGAVLNISSIASVIAAASGIPVVKHGNRGASSASGASDVLSALGLNLEISPERVAQVLSETGITFAFAAMFHPGFRHAGPTRKELGISTLFNILGPLCNPARPEASAVGVASLDRVPLVVGVFQTRGATALVYRGDDGIDKLTTTGHSHIWEVSRGFVTEHDLNPIDLGIPLAEISSLLGADPAHNAAVARAVLGASRVRCAILCYSMRQPGSPRLSWRKTPTSTACPSWNVSCARWRRRRPRWIPVVRRRSSTSGSRQPTPKPCE
jgi:anthranilate phosphoribosyltransferase